MADVYSITIVLDNAAGFWRCMAVADSILWPGQEIIVDLGAVTGPTDVSDEVLWTALMRRIITKLNNK